MRLLRVAPPPWAREREFVRRSSSSTARDSRFGRGSPEKFGGKVWVPQLPSVPSLGGMAAERPRLVSEN